MCISTTTTASGIKIKFDTASMPLTSSLKNLIEGKKGAKPEENIAKQLTPVKRRLTITCGEATPQMSSTEARSVQILSRDDEDMMASRKYWNAKAKKPKGKKQKGAATIRTMYLN
jgi:hypothetical protein